MLYQVSVFEKNLRSTGEIYLCDDHGTIFISDIDNTNKITGVTSTTNTLINTFSGDFKPAPDMADIYQYWQKKYDATFAYITALPDQLYPFLREFIDREKFPSGTFHMVGSKFYSILPVYGLYSNRIGRIFIRKYKNDAKWTADIGTSIQRYTTAQMDDV